MKKSSFVSMLLGVLAFSAFAAFADHHEGTQGKCEQHHMEVDTNKDGKVSFDEFKAAREKHMEEHFKRHDTNQDGFIDEAERKAHHDQHRHGKKDRCEMHK